MSGQLAPTVSVILPTYNRAHLIQRAISSVLAQSFGDFELIVVDDASTDNTQQVVQGFTDQRLAYLRKPSRGGAAAARNTGIRLSAGRYIAFQDSDDAWRPGKLERILQIFSTCPPTVGVVYSGFRWIRSPRTGVSPSPGRVWLSRCLPTARLRLQGDLRLALLRGNFITTQAAVVRSECFEQVGMFDEALPRLQDWELWIRLSKAYSFRFINQPLVAVYATPGSLSEDRQALDDAFQQLIAKHCLGTEEDNELLAQYDFAMGDLSLRSGQAAAGRGRLFQALKRSPFNMTGWLAALAALAGSGVYRKIAGWAGFGYG